MTVLEESISLTSGNCYRIVSSDAIILVITHKKDSEKILKKYK
jgi:hypothetical protein